MFRFVQEYERTFIRLRESPEAFAKLSGMHPNNNFGVVSGVDYFSTLELSDKLAQLDDEEVQTILEDNRRTRLGMYDRLLPAAAFNKLDSSNWNRLSKHFAEKTGKPMLEYPFSDLPLTRVEGEDPTPEAAVTAK